MKSKRLLKIPEKNGEFFCSHNLSDISSLLKSNQQLTDSYDIKIAENSYKQFRKKVEGEIFNLMVDKNNGPYTRPYIATGHQPILYHPGIWIKNMLIDKLADENKGSAFDFIIDSDCMDDIGCYVLTQNEKLEKKKEVFMKLDSRQPIECYPVPSVDKFRKFLQNIQMHMPKTFSDNHIMNYLEKFLQEGETSLPVSKNLAEFLIKIRKGYEEGSIHYSDIMVSEMCGSSSFLQFVLHIAQDSEHFFEIYNQKLEEYRINHKLRYKANPFPDLKKDVNKFEIPFWMIKDNFRKPVYVLQEGLYTSFYIENKLVFEYKKGDFENAIKIIKEKKINFRPKAISLTLFVRLFFADIFIHGVGGAKYDEVTDGIIEKYFKVKPPDYIAVSLTLFPDLPLNGVQKKDIDQLKTQIRNIKFKPEIFEDKIKGEELQKSFRQLIEQKKKKLQQGPSGKNKKEFYQQIKVISDELSCFLDQFNTECRNELKVLEEREKENQAICCREYPYFFYDVNRVRNVI